MMLKKQISYLLNIVLIISLLSNVSCTSEKEKGKTADSSSIGWKVIGPGGGGGVLKPTISPLDEDFVMVHCDMTAAYVSTNAGKNWQMKNLWNVPDDFEFDPVDPNTVYVATRGFRHSEDRGSGLSILYRSTDKGESWEIVYPDVSKAKKGLEMLQSYDLLPSEIIEGAFDGSIQKVAVDPADNKRIYVGLAPMRFYMNRSNSAPNPDSAILIRSDDYGKTWSKVASLPGRGVQAIFPASETGLNDEVLVFTENHSVYINEKTNKINSFPLPVRFAGAVEGGISGGKSVIFLQSRITEKGGKYEGGMYVSMDQGKTWKQINNGLLDKVAPGESPDFRRGLAVCESQPEVAYISVVSRETNKEGSIDLIFYIYKTTDAGQNWKPVMISSTPGGYISDNFNGSWMEVSYDPGWGGAPIDLGVAPGNPDICYAGDNGRGYKTLDGGKTWAQTYSHKMEDGSYASGGLDVTTCYGVHFDPFDKNHFFICYTDMGLFHTYNFGESWHHALNGIGKEWENTCYEVEFDPGIKDKVWSVWANAHDLPRTKMFGSSGSFDRYKGGVALSEDGGKSWKKSNAGIPENAICTNILMDPDSPVGNRTLYVSVFDKGVYKSSDDGKNWECVNNGLGDNLYAWQIRRNPEGRLFVLCSRGYRRGNTVDGNVYYSDDQANSWKELNMPEGVNGPHDLLVDNNDSKVIYMSCWPKKTEEGDKCGGVYKTIDGGESWSQVFDERIRVNSAAMDPENSEILYINTFQNAAYRSADAGENWKRIEGYRFKWGQRPVPDPHHPGMLFLTTYGGSVFYGPAEGIPGVFEGIVNMPENWW